MYCQNCGNKLNKDASFCDKCGQKTNENVNEEKSINVNINEKVKAPYSTAKLIIGIISMVLFLLICFQSCAVGLSNAISDNGETSGSDGFLCAIFMIVGGIVSVATRNSNDKGGAITAVVFYFLASLMTLGTGTSFGDLPIWGSIAFIFGLINLASVLIKNKFFSQEKNKKFLTTGLVVISIIAFIIGFSSGTSTDDSSSNSNNDKTSVSNTTNKKENNGTNNNSNKKNYALDEMFVFDDLEITLGSEVSYTTVSNSYSDHNGKTVVKMPITVKNLKDETHSLSMFYFKIFGSQGTELDSVSSYFDNDCVEYAGDLRTGASYTKYLYFLYDGNGTYAVEFDNWSKKITVEFDVTK